MKKPTRTILIDPIHRTIEVHEMVVSAEETKNILQCPTLDHFRLAEHEDEKSGKISWDYGWVDDTGLSRGEPIHAFKFDIKSDPIAGRCLLTGVDKQTGDTIDVKITVEFLREHIEWLGVIVPEVTWDRTENVDKAIVTYSRVKA